MATTSSRTLRLLSLLQNHRYWAGDELAGRLQVSVRTLRRDVDRLRELGYPVSSNRGVDGGYQLQAGAAMPPLLLDDDEAVGLAVALQSAAATSASGLAESSLRALAKLSQVMPPRLRSRVDALRESTDTSWWAGPDARPSVDPALLVTVAVLCRDRERLRFRYVSHASESSDRHVEPLRLVSLGRRWYLVAFDLDRQDWRTFRMDRIGEPHGTGNRFAARQLPGDDPAAFVRNGVVRTMSLTDVVAEVTAPAEQLRNRFGRWATIEAIDATHCRLRMEVDSLDWPALLLGSTGAEFRVVEPTALVALLDEWADRFGRAVQSGGGSADPR